ncbi:MAG: hypothetical protein IKQ59_06410 [Prevotella sp.]|nr:hypothetical protein [Prevotella sp.]
MKKIMRSTFGRLFNKNWVLAATFCICGASVFTSCSNDNSNSIEQADKNRKEFVAHTRATLKDLAENLNFSSWNAANTLNLHFNQYVLNNPDFEKAVLNAFMQKVMTSVKPVEAGSELAAMGYQMYGTVDLTDFNYRFTMNAENTGFDIEEADDFEVILNAWNPTTQQVEAGLYRLTLKSGGSTTYKFEHAMSQQPGMALVVLIPSEFQFSIADRLSGQWHDGFSGSFKNQVSVADGHEYAQLDRDTWTVAGTITSDFAGVTALGAKADKTTLDFSILSDKVNNKGDVALSWSQNGRKMLDLALKESGDGTGGIYRLDLSQFTSSSSILDVIAPILTTRNLNEAKLTLLDDLTTTLSISNMTKALEVAREGAAARRAYADQATIDQYTQQLNQLVSAKITCKGVNQEIPMRLVTTKLGVDWWTMPAFNFADENGYVSLVDLLDSQSVAYGINIIDHAAAPMQQSIIVVRQLLQYLQGLVSGFQQSQPAE